MTRQSLRLIAALLMIGGVTIGQNPLYWPDPTWRAPESAAARANPLVDATTTAGGKKLFLRHCAECHGKDGTGVAKKHAADLQLPLVQIQSDGVLFWKITNGNTGRGMPSFSKLPEGQRWQIVQYLRRLRPPSSSL